MEKGYRIFLTVSLLLTIFTTTAQTTDTSKDNFPSTQEALSHKQCHRHHDSQYYNG